ncbi:hypothetical protein VNO77_03304 [Canavalia gladiata]|uniref:Uncharacterized protein n=1 Tax=Canavalia gladiata TaxID=3824 RepID=A0AAN9MWH8_CANGL
MVSHILDTGHLNLGVLISVSHSILTAKAHTPETRALYAAFEMKLSLLFLISDGSDQMFRSSLSLTPF